MKPLLMKTEQMEAGSHVGGCGVGGGVEEGDGGEEVGGGGLQS